MGSTVDPEATFRNHGKQSQLGYNVNVAATERFVREIAAVTGATPDGSGIADLISAQAEHLGVVPPKLIYDQAAGYAKYFAQVQRLSKGQTQLVARLVGNGSNKERFGPLDFTLDEQGHLSCPNGQRATKPFRTLRSDASGWTYPFYPKQCDGCPLADKCRGDKVKPTSRRTVFISDYIYNQREAIAYAQTDDFAQDMKLRSHIERIIAGLTRYNSARRADAYGLLNADYQAKMSGMAYNLKRWAALQLEQEQRQKKRWRDQQRLRNDRNLIPHLPDLQLPVEHNNNNNANAPPRV